MDPVLKTRETHDDMMVGDLTLRLLYSVCTVCACLQTWGGGSARRKREWSLKQAVKHIPLKLTMLGDGTELY